MKTTNFDIMCKRFIGVLFSLMVMVATSQGQHIKETKEVLKVATTKHKLKGSGPVIQSAVQPVLGSSHSERCKTHLLHKELLQNDPSYAARIIANEAIVQNIIQSPNRSAGVVYTIPLVFHVIHLGESVGTGTNISDAQIMSAVANINDAYRNNSPYNGVDTEIEFCLAQRDPSNNTTNGINRVDGSGTSDFSTNGITTSGSNNEASIKGLSVWPNTDYLNIWVVAGIDGNMGGIGIQGYSYLPGGVSANLDGVVILYNSVGYDPTGSLGYNVKPSSNLNTTLTHELGHALDLFHTFQGDMGVSDTGPSQCPQSGNGCATWNGSSWEFYGDCVADTPPHIRSNSDCNVAGTNACDGNSSNTNYVHNFMDYSSETCQTQFTSGQSTRMRAAIAGIRASLTTSNACTPVFSLDATIASIDAPSASHCGSSVNPSVTIQNNGSTTITSAVLTYNIDGGSNQVFNWSGSLTNGATEAVSLSSMTTTAGAHTFNITISSPNGGTDLNTANDASSGNFTVTIGNPLTLSVFTNQFGSENSWIVKNTSGSTIASGPSPAYANEVAVGSYPQPDEELCLSDGCYDFVMLDSFGDGMCCADGNGLYILSDNSSNILASGSSFTFRDSTRFCVPYVAAPPSTDFTASNVSIPVGSTINFTDLSTGTPTPFSWAWTFEGGSPTTSTQQHPTVTYNTAGVYSVTLTASNTSGPSSEIKTSYINVFNATGGSCDTVTNMLANDTTTAYMIQGQWGTFPGHNGTMIEEYADQQFVSSASTLQRISLYLFQATAGSPSSTVTFKVWDDNSGIPGTVISSESVLISDLVGGAYNSIQFTPAPSINGTYYVGYELNYGAGDTIIGGTAIARLSGTPATAFVEVGGVWSDANTLFGGSFATSYDIRSYFSDGLATANYTTSSNVVCSGDSIYFDGTSSYNAADYFWDLDGNGTLDATGDALWVPYLGSGTAFPELFVVGGCAVDSFTTSITINDITATFSSTNVSSVGGSDGSATVTASGGSGYTYLWDNGSASSTASGLAAGVHCVTVTGSSGCSTSSCVTITEPASPLAVTTNVTDENCSLSDGSITTSVTGGTPPYSYLWSNGPITSSISGIQSGSYTVTVTDFNNVSVIETNTVSSVGGSLSASATNENCGLSDGTATATLIGGTLPYSYDWGANSANQNTMMATGLGSGSYSVTVTDAVGCEYSTSVFVTNSAGITTSLSSTNLLCNSVCDGSASVSASGGTPPYTYLWTNTQTSQNATGLCAGTSYIVTVTDNSGCSLTETVLLTEPSGLLVAYSSTPEMCDSSNGTAMISVTGGVGPYFYQWPSGNTTNMDSNLVAGDYIVIVADNNNCTDTATITINSGGTFNAAITPDAEICEGDTILLSVAGGNTWIWSTGSTSSSIQASTSGTYICTVSDGSSCTQTLSTDVIVHTVPVISLTQSADTICPGESISLIASGADTYSWTPGNLNGFSITVNPTASQSIYSVIGYNGTCASTPIVTQIPFYSPLPKAVASANITAADVGDIINFSSAGSVADSYHWDFDGNTVVDDSTANPSYSYSANNEYEVVLTTFLDGATCSATDTLIIKIGKDVGISGFSTNHSINVFPNPTTGKLNILFGNKIADKRIISLYNALGQQVLEMEVTGNESAQIIDLSSYSKGIYSLNIISGSEKVSKKVMLVK